MARYSSKPIEIAQPVEGIFERLSDFSKYQEKLDELPANLREKIGDVSFTPDSIIINAAPVGEIAFEVIERIAPKHVKLQAKNAPVPMFLIMDFEPDGEDAAKVTSTIDVEIPAMLRPMVGGKMQEAANKFGEMLGNFFGAGK